MSLNNCNSPYLFSLMDIFITKKIWEKNIILMKMRLMI
jgi:hypothetical protein